MNFSFITKSEDQLRTMLTEVNYFIQKDDSPQLQTMRENLEQCIESLGVFRTEKRLNIDIMRDMKRDYKDELDELFSELTYSETFCKVSFRNEFNIEDTEGYERRYQFQRDISALFNKKFVKDLFKKKKLGFGSYKNLSVINGVRIQLSLPKKVEPEILLEKFRALSGGIVNFVEEIFELREEFSTLNKVVSVIPLRRLEVLQTNRYSIEKIKDKLYSLKVADEEICVEVVRSGIKFYNEKRPEVYCLERGYYYRDFVKYLEENF